MERRVKKELARECTHSALLVNGTRCISGRRQPARPIPASAVDAPMIFMKCRRDTSPPLNSAAPCGNSRSSAAANSGVAASSSRLRQYFLPPCGSDGC